MRVVVSGHAGYLGSVMVPRLAAAGHQVTGLDTFLYEECTFGDPAPTPSAIRKDIRDIEASDLEGFDAVIHLAAISNDPVGNLNPQTTFDINHLATVRLAEAAKKAGVPRFLFASSCSLYGAAEGDVLLDETAPFNPVTAYGESKIRSESDVVRLAEDNFSPTFLRLATAYGFSPRLRADIVVNNLVGWATTKGEVLIKSDGTPWRPLVHAEDIAAAFAAVLEAPRERVHAQALNVGANAENYQIRQVADLVQEVVPGSVVAYAPGGEPDIRNYRVDFSKIGDLVPAFQPSWTVRKGVEQLYAAYLRYQLTPEDFEGRLVRITHIRRLQAEGRLDSDLRWT